MSKEITVFTEGDSTDSSVWSNVPYYLTTTLESMGYQINRVNVAGNPLLRFLYDRLLCPIIRRSILKGTSFTYNRSILYTLQLRLLLKKAVKRFPHSYCFISTSFSFSPALYTDKPCILFCDWTYEYYIQHFLKRQPDFLERFEIRRQTQVLESASIIFSLFPDIASYMKTHYQNREIYYLGNVINSPAYKRDVLSCSIRLKEKHLLFIGVKKYIAGAKSLIEAGRLLQKRGISIQIDIIGMNEKDFDSPSLPEFVHCHGYLNKNSTKEKELYYSIMNNALIYVNTTPVWAGFSSCLEALYHYVPIITTPYQSFIDTFGEHIDFGYYCSENDPSTIADYLFQIINLPVDEYLDYCSHAHNVSLPFTWNTYVTNMLKFIEK